MRFLKTLFHEKYWLFMGSFVGGSVGALVVHLNVLMTSEGLPMGTESFGLMYSTGLGMIGGLIGGCIGSFIAGVMAKAEVIFNVGVSMGIGLMNGFISGVLTGLVMGMLHRWYPHMVSPAVMFVAMAVVVLLAFIVSLFWKGESGSGYPKDRA